jgi:hypothetical protein
MHRAATGAFGPVRFQTLSAKVIFLDLMGIIAFDAHREGEMVRASVTILRFRKWAGTDNFTRTGKKQVQA